MQDTQARYGLQADKRCLVDDYPFPITHGKEVKTKTEGAGGSGDGFRTCLVCYVNSTSHVGRLLP